MFHNAIFHHTLPDTAWVFEKDSPKFNVRGWSQGAYKKYGKGRIVAFGEAAMFSAQVAGSDKRKMGMNHEVATECTADRVSHARAKSGSRLVALSSRAQLVCMVFLAMNISRALR